MGNIPPVSSKCIPMPDDEFLKVLTARGLQLTSMDDMVELPGTMTSVKLPDNWGLIWESDRKANKQIIFLIDENQTSVARITWMEKERKSETLPDPTPKKLDVTKVTFFDGLYEVINTVTPFETQYQQMKIDYQNHVLTNTNNQAVLDAHYAKLQQFFGDHAADIQSEEQVRLVANTEEEFVSNWRTLGQRLIPDVDPPIPKVFDIPWLTE